MPTDSIRLTSLHRLHKGIGKIAALTCRSLTIKPAETSRRERIRRWLLADTPALASAERRYSALGALMGVAVCIWLLDGLPAHSYWLLAPMGASAIILFGMSSSPVAQPWPVLGGYLVACCAGLLASTYIGPTLLAAGVAVALTLWLMARLNCLHPPGGALALLFVLDKKSYLSSTAHSLALVAANVALLLLCAAIINNLIPGRRYPHRAVPDETPVAGAHDNTPLRRTDLSHDDLVSAMRSIGGFVDVREEELARLYALAIDHAFSRHVGLTCADVMSRDVVSVATNATIGDAWTLLREHRIKALPVVDAQGRLAGIVSLSDLVQPWHDVGPSEAAPAGVSGMPVSQWMTTQVQTATPETSMASLARAAAQNGHHHIPVVDGDGQLVGILTPSDMIAALYRRLALERHQF